MDRRATDTRNPATGRGAPVSATVTHIRRRQAAHALRRLRVELGLSQEQAAALCGVCPRTWGAWERAAVPLRALEAFLVLQAGRQRSRAAGCAQRGPEPGGVDLCVPGADAISRRAA